jgi:hypothetical protein
MRTVVIYKFVAYDLASHSYQLSARQGTLAAIASVLGISLRQTASEVSIETLDASGFLKLPAPE